MVLVSNTLTCMDIYVVYIQLLRAGFVLEIFEKTNGKHDRGQLGLAST
jgi:hypothetical protein